MTALTDVSETLLMTLYFRSLETKKPNAIIKDEKAVEVVKNINYDFSMFDQDWKSQVAVAVRTEIIDQAVQEFLFSNPDAIIVNLGAGLCTRFFRLDNGRVQWFEVDLEQVKPSWDKLIGETERHRFIACSVVDFSWMDVISTVIKGDSNQRVLFIAEGLFMYLPEDEVKRVILEIKNRFPSSEILIEVIGKYLANNTQLHRSVAQTNAKFKWGADDCKELETWEPGIQLVAQWYFSDRHRDRQGWLKFLSYIPAVRQQAKVGHFKLSNAYPPHSI